jgi:hypothetical protein
VPRCQNHIDVIRASGDWLDSCWRCGSAEARLDRLGRLLCSGCLAELTGAGSPEDPLHVVRSAYWDAHALERCWRCLDESVEADDDVGLCRVCLASLSVKATNGEGAGGR